MAFIAVATAWFVVYEAVKVCRYKPKPLPTRALNALDEQWVHYAMKSIGGE